MKKRTSVSIVWIIIGMLAAVGVMSWAKRHLLCILPLPKGKCVKYEYPAKYLVIDKTGKVVLETDKHLEGHFSEGLCPFFIEKDDKRLYGYLDIKGNVAIEPVYYWVDDFWEGTGDVLINGWQHGFIDRKGNLVKLFWPWEKFEDRKIQRKHQVFLQAKDFNGRWGYVDSTGKTVIPGRFAYAENIFFDGFAACAIDVSAKPKPNVRYYPVYDCGKLALIPNQELSFETPTIADILVDMKFGLIDQSGNWVLQPKYDSIQYACNGMRMVEKDRKFGFISSDGTEKIPPIYNGASNFGIDYAVVSTGEFQNYSRNAVADGVHYSDFKDGVIPFNTVMLPKNIEAALRVCDEVIKLKPRCATIYSEKACFLLCSDRYEEALEACNQGLSFAPKRIDLLGLRASVLLKLKLWSDAEQGYSKFIEACGRGASPGAYQSRGLARLRQNKLIEAKEDIFVNSAFENMINPGSKMTPAVDLEGISREEAAEVFEKLGDEKNAQRVILESRPSQIRETSCDFCTVKLETKLSDEYNRREKELGVVLANPASSQYSVLKAKILTADAIRPLVAAKRIASKCDDEQALLRREIELLSQVPEVKEKSGGRMLSSQTSVNRAKANLNESYRLTNYSRAKSKIKMDSELLKLANDTHIVDISKYIHEPICFNSCSHLTLPSSTGKENSTQNLEIARRCAAGGYSNIAWVFAEQAESAASTLSERKMIETFCRTRLSPKGIDVRAIEKYHKSLSEYKGNYSYLGSPEIPLREWNLRLALKLSPNFTAAHVALADEYRQQHRLKLAENELDRAERINPNFLEIWIEHGRIAELKGDVMAAKRAYSRATKLDPENQLAHRLLVNLSSAASN